MKVINDPRIAQEIKARKKSLKRAIKAHSAPTPEQQEYLDIAENGYIQVSNKGNTIMFRYTGIEVASTDGGRTFWDITRSQQIRGSVLKCFRFRANRKRLTQKWWGAESHCAHRTGVFEAMGEHGLPKRCRSRV